jgi:hypothetical protein
MNSIVVLITILCLAICFEFTSATSGTLNIEVHPGQTRCVGQVRICLAVFCCCCCCWWWWWWCE